MKHRLLPGRLRIRSGTCVRDGRRWKAKVAVSDGAWIVEVAAKASAPGLAVRRAFDAAVREILRTPPEGGA